MGDIKSDNNIDCILITEANEKVATGHLMEIAELSALLNRENIKTKTIVNYDMPAGLINRVAGEIEVCDGDVNDCVDQIADIIRESSASVIVTDLREVKNEWVLSIKEKTGCILICIDEFGHRTLEADIIINPMIDSYYWDYGNSKAKIYSGHEYLVLPEKIRLYHEKEKRINDKIENVCISMGGVDYYGTTCKLARWLLNGENHGCQWNIVIGSAFKHLEELISVVDNSHSKVRVFQNIDYIYDLFYEADVAFCAGGNTLHELACIGTPTITIPTMPHEFKNGKRYEELGFGKCLEQTNEIKRNSIIWCNDDIMRSDIRHKLSCAGKKICDGNGGRRMLQIIKSTICNGI